MFRAGGLNVGLRRRVGGALAAALCAGLLGGCADDPPTLIRELDSAKPVRDAPWNLKTPVRGSTLSIQPGWFLCSKGAVRITSLTLVYPSSGIRLVRWGVENERITLDGSAEVPLNRFGHYYSHAIARPCIKGDGEVGEDAAPEQTSATGSPSDQTGDDDGGYARIGIELHLSSKAPQRFSGLRIAYQSDGEQIVAYMPFAVATFHQRS